MLAPFSQHMLVQHIGVPSGDAERAESVIRLQIAIGLGCDPDALVVRTSEVCETTRDGTAKVEHISFAMSRDDVMRYVELARRAKVQGTTSSDVFLGQNLKKALDAAQETYFARIKY